MKVSKTSIERAYEKLLEEGYIRDAERRMRNILVSQAISQAEEGAGAGSGAAG